MMNRVGTETEMSCRQARKRFASKAGDVERHVTNCARCAFEYRLYALRQATLDAAASEETFTPDSDFFRGLRARIARGPELARPRPMEETWTAALLLTARQLVPAMAVLLLLIAGATLFVNQSRPEISQVALRPRDRVVFSDMYDYPAPTREDVLETLVAAEEKENGK